MEPEQYKAYAYRWVILLVFMFINLMIQTLWICFAPITSITAKFYGVSEFNIGLLAMLFMIVYLPLSIPVSWAIDMYGYQKAVGAGALLLGVFGLLRGVFAENYTIVFLCTIGLAIAQPFMLNAISTVSAKWFPLQERATAAGLIVIAIAIGIAAGQVISPMIVTSYKNPRIGIPAMQMIYGVAAAVCAILFLLFTREAPPTPPGPKDHTSHALVFDGLKQMLHMKDMWVLLFLVFVSNGVFNGVSTWIEGIVRPKGFSIIQTGNLGGALLIGGIFGAGILPLFSDKLRKRKIFLVISMLLTAPGTLGVIISQNYIEMTISMFFLGFFLSSLAPLAYQFAAEITHPLPEGTSNGLLNLFGQASVIFIFGMQEMKNISGSFTSSLVLLIILSAISGLLSIAMHESKLIKAK